jgi:hypothetical protein
MIFLEIQWPGQSIEPFVRDDNGECSGKGAKWKTAASQKLLTIDVHIQVRKREINSAGHFPNSYYTNL